VTDATVEEIAQRLEGLMDAEEATQTPKEETPETEESVETEEVEYEETEEMDESGEDEEVEETEEVEESEDEPWMPESINELAEAMEVELDALKAIKLNTKVDGVEGEATLGEVLKNYQLNKSLTNKSEKLAQDVKEFEAFQQERLQKLNDTVTQVEALSQVMEQQIEAEVSAIDWNQLREDDPAEYAAKRQEFIERIGSLQQVKEQALQKRDLELSRTQEKLVQEHQERLVQSHNALVDAIPEWRDESVMKQGMAEVQGFLKTRGVTDEEISQIWDSRMVLMARDAMLYSNMSDKAQLTKKKAKNKPKFVKPGSRKAKQTANEDRIQTAKKRFSSTGSLDDAAALLLERMN
jgi:hypothetical protein